MDSETKSFLKSMEGRDEDGVSNAICSLQILRPGEDSMAEVMGCSTTDAETEFHIIPGGYSGISVFFEDGVDYDFLQMEELCLEYNRMSGMIEEAESKEGRNDKQLILSLTLAPADTIGEYVSAICHDWSYDVRSSREMCNGIRFRITTENMRIVSLPEDSFSIPQ